MKILRKVEILVIFMSYLVARKVATVIDSMFTGKNELLTLPWVNFNAVMNRHNYLKQTVKILVIFMPSLVAGKVAIGVVQCSREI